MVTTKRFAADDTSADQMDWSASPNLKAVFSKSQTFLSLSKSFFILFSALYIHFKIASGTCMMRKSLRAGMKSSVDLFSTNSPINVKILRGAPVLQVSVFPTTHEDGACLCPGEIT